MSRTRRSVDNSVGHRSRTISTSSEQVADSETDVLLPGSGETTPLLEIHTETEVPRGHDASGHGHGSHGSMNMRALVLHVIGDALGNVGVIGTGLVIWLSNWSFKYYFDPTISLVITVIIFSSALPLGTLSNSLYSQLLTSITVRSASFILLQGVPSTISLDEVRESILDVDGVLSLHELHVWQLSETKIIASVHVLTSRDHDFMPVAAKIRKTLHHHGIHSSTIQPEYLKSLQPLEVGNIFVRYVPLLNRLQVSEESACLIVCPQDHECNPREHACCRTCSTLQLARQLIPSQLPRLLTSEVNVSCTYLTLFHVDNTLYTRDSVAWRVVVLLH